MKKSRRGFKSTVVKELCRYVAPLPDMDVDSFINRFATEGNKVPEYSIEESAGTAYYVANRYVAIRLWVYVDGSQTG